MENYTKQNFQKYSPIGKKRCPYRLKRACWLWPKMPPLYYPEYFDKPVFQPKQQNGIEKQAVWGSSEETWIDSRSQPAADPVKVQDQQNGSGQQVAVPADPIGLLHEAMISRLQEFGLDIDFSDSNVITALSSLSKNELLALLILVIVG